MTTLYLMRHGENPANVHHILSYRRADFRLTARGVEQAVRTRRQFADLARCGVWSSPLRRAVHTAELIGPTVTILEDLREVNVGDLDGACDADAHHEYQRVITAWRAGNPTLSFPAGENLLTAARRLARALATIVTAWPTAAVVVGHGALLTEGLSFLLRPADRRRLHAASEPRWLNCETAQLTAGVDGRGTLALSWQAWHPTPERVSRHQPRSCHAR